MKRRISKRWLINGIITTILFGIVMIPVIRDEIKVKTDAADAIPLLTGTPIGWNQYNTDYELLETETGSDVFTRTFNLQSGQYQLTKKASNPWVHFPSTDFDGENSKPGQLVLPKSDNKDFYLLCSGNVTITMYNPDNNALSPAGSRRFIVDYSSTPDNAQTHLVLGGYAVNNNNQWISNDPDNRLTGLNGFNGRYAIIERGFNAAEFKAYVWETWDGDWGWSSVDTSLSTAINVIQKSPSATSNNIKVNTAGTYRVIFDTKTMKIIFNTQATNEYMVNKYDGTTIIEKEAAFSGKTYTPSAVNQPGKRFGGWYEDAAFTIPYVPREISSNVNLYGKYEFKQDTKLSFYDRNQTISTGDVYAFGWNLNGSLTLGNWPGTKMTNHNFGYHSLDIIAANVSERIIFNNGKTGVENGEVQTGDLDWELGKNLFTYDGVNKVWGNMSAVHHEATLFAISILDDTDQCDPTGATNKVSTTSWDMLEYNFDSLSAEVKLDLKNAVANVNGDLVAQAMARYDYVVNKYGTATKYRNFINRTISTGGVRQPQPVHTDKITVISVISGFAIVTLIGISAIRKRKYN